LSKSTEQYGDFFEKNNIISLEPMMFATKSETPFRHLSQVFGALNYLKSRNDVDKNSISIVGLSYGASLSIYAITKWANQNFNDGQTGFKSAFALYPTCFFHQNLMQKDARTINRLKGFGFPDNFHDSWLGVPLKIYAGGKDDYENREAQPCSEFFSLITDENQKKLTSVTHYPEATHRWDAEHNHSFNDPLACKWKGCAVNVIADAALTEKVKKDILETMNKQP
jgi:dienelactone hydrolase